MGGGAARDFGMGRHHRGDRAEDTCILTIALGGQASSEAQPPFPPGLPTTGGRRDSPRGAAMALLRVAPPCAASSPLVAAHCGAPHSGTKLLAGHLKQLLALDSQSNARRGIAAENALRGNCWGVESTVALSIGFCRDPAVAGGEAGVRTGMILFVLGILGIGEAQMAVLTWQPRWLQPAVELSCRVN